MIHYFGSVLRTPTLQLRGEYHTSTVLSWDFMYLCSARSVIRSQQLSQVVIC